MSFHARTEPHSRYAIFFIQSGGQVKNIVLNIILYTTQPQRILSFATRECARRIIVRRIMRRGRWSLLWNSSSGIAVVRKRRGVVRFTKCSQPETKSLYFKFEEYPIESRRDTEGEEQSRFREMDREIFICNRRGGWRRL